MGVLTPHAKKSTKAKKKGGAAGMVRRPDAAEANNIYMKDMNQLDLCTAISSMEMLKIADKFDQYPGEELDLEQFVNTMKDVIGDHGIARREDYI